MHSSFANPTHTMRLDGPMDWATPPFVSRMPWAEDDGPIPVRVETLRGYEVDGEMLGFDAKHQSLIFRFDETGRSLRVGFHRFRRLTLLQAMDDAEARMVFASHLRKFRIALNGDGQLVGRTAGHVETRAGLFLFTPDDDERTLHRAFVPAGAYTRCILGPSVEEDAAQRWIATPEVLAELLDSSRLRRRVIAIGEAIYDLGVVSARQLSSTLVKQATVQRVPLGEMLVADGLLARADLRTALGHKMGYPLVNLARFPLDATALERMPLDDAFECNALPLMLRDGKLIVAVDNLARVAQLAGIPSLAGLKVVPVLARQIHVEAALLRAYQAFGSRVWNEPRRAWKLTAPMAA